MENFFSEQSYYEFPSIEAAIYALMLSFLLSTIIAFTYKLTFRGVEYSKDFFQAIVLIAIIAATIMMAIGDSLARGLGILGALAIIRFRYRFDNPKNIIYIFASLAIGIACGVYGFAIALSGAIVFSLVSFVLYFSPIGKTMALETSISFSIGESDDLSTVEDLLKQSCDFIKLIGISASNDMLKYEYQVSLKEGIDRDIFFRKLKDIKYIKNLRINNRPSVDRV